jgi:hypothetical protein
MSVGILTKTNSFSAPFKVVGGDSHTRLFVWGKWGKEDNDTTVVKVMVAFESGGPWFPYHEGEMEPVEDDKGEIIGEETVDLVLTETDWRTLKDIHNLWVRFEAVEPDEETNIHYKLV